MPVSWWQYRPVTVKRKQQADEFSDFVDEQQNPPTPKPWDAPGDEPDKGMPVGPDAARRLDQRANQQRQRWQNAMQNAIGIDQQPPVGPSANGAPSASARAPGAVPPPPGGPVAPPESPSPWAPW